MQSKLLLIFVFLYSCAISLAQERVLGYPLKFEKSVDRFDNTLDYEAYIGQTEKKGYSKSIGWMVISDRANNKTYSSPDAKAPAHTYLDFKDVLYVVKEEGFWVQLVKAKVNGLKIARLEQDCGWIPKKKLLLWNAALRDPQSRIIKRGLVNYKLSDIVHLAQKKDTSHITNIYAGPNTDTKITGLRHGVYYFIFKKENNKYLLAREVSVGKRTAATEIIGWIPQTRIADVNTRLFIEPNFEAAAYQERQENEHLRFRCFSDRFSAEDYSNGQEVSESKIILQNDPAEIPKDQLASDGRRMKGGVMRFPVIKFVPRQHIRIGGPVSLRFAKEQAYVFLQKSYPNYASQDLTNFIDKNEDFLKTLYSESYIPIHIKGAKYPLNSYVTQFAERELKDYIFRLKGLYLLKDLSIAEKRKQYYQFHLDLLEYYWAGKELKEKEMKTFSKQNILALMIGVYKQGIPLTEDNYLIGDILDAKKMSDAEIDKALDNLITNINTLEDIKRSGERYEFSYNSGENLYFWIPLKDLL